MNRNDRNVRRESGQNEGGNRNDQFNRPAGQSLMRSNSGRQSNQSSGYFNNDKNPNYITLF